MTPEALMSLTFHMIVIIIGNLEGVLRVGGTLLLLATLLLVNLGESIILDADHSCESLS